MSTPKKRSSPEKKTPKKASANLSSSTKNTDNFRIELTSLQKPVENFLKSNEISVLYGTAGTGKDFIQLHRAIAGLLAKEFDQVVLLRSAVEVGASIGFLPGEEKDKLAPYEKLFYENLSKMLEKTVFEKVRGKIKFENIGFIRGRTFDYSCCILSEAQNCSLHEIITVCTRMAHTSKLLINGDFYQSDVRNSGFKNFIGLVEGMNGVGTLELGDEFQMRNPMIVELDKRHRKFLNGVK
jgi:phosphate starvation-inducible PhoH-like protein